MGAAHAQTFVWDGGGTDDLFGTGVNWIGDATPGVGPGVYLHFSGSLRPTPSNNYTTGDNFGEWHLLNSATTGFTVTGNGFGLYGKIENDAGSNQTFTVNTAGIYARDGSIELNPVGGNLVVGAPVELDDNASLNVWDGGNNRTLTLNGALSNGNGNGGSGSLTLNETAAVILAADSDYGATTINGGTKLQVGAGSTTGTLGSGAVINNGSLSFNRSNPLAVANAISGTGSVVVTAGTIAFSNQKTYTGNTTINGGILDLTGGGGGSGAIRGTATVNTGGTLRLSTGDATGYNIGAASLTTINLNGGTLNLNTASNQTLGGAVINMTGGAITGIAGSNLDFFNTTSAVNVLNSAAQASISGTQIKLRQNGGVTFTVANGSQDTDLLVSSVIANADGYTNNNLKKAGAGTMQISAANTFNTAVEVLEGRLLVTGFNGLLNTSGITVSSGATLELGATNIFVGGHGTAMANSRVITVNGGTLLMNGSFDARFGNVTLNNGATWTSNRALTGWDALLANTSAGAATVSVTGTGVSTINGSGGIHLQGFQTFNVADTVAGSGNDLVVTSRLDNGGTAGGTGGVTKTGAGTMLLNGYNTYSGGTTINGGVLAVDGSQVNNRLTNNHAVTVNNTGVFEIRGVNALPTAASGVDVTVNAGGTFRVLSGGSAAIGAGGTSHAHIRHLNLAGGTVDLAYSGGGSAYNGESFQLNGDVTVTGGASSTIQFGSGGNAGNAGLAVIGTRTFNVGEVATGTDLLVSAEIENSDSGGGGIAKSGTGTMVLTGANSYTGNTTINAGTLGVTGQLYSGTHNNTAVVQVNSGGTLQVASFAYDAAGGLGMLSDYRERRVLNGGTIEVTGSSHSSGNDFTVNAAGGTFRYSATGQTLTLDGNVNTDIQLDGALTVDAGGNIAVAEVMAGTGSIIKTGSGTLTLSGTNSYSGTTTVNGGKLVVNGSIDGASTTTVNASGILAGSGTLGGAAAVDGTLAPGNSIGTLNFGSSLTLGSSSVSTFEIDPLLGLGLNADRANIAGAVSLGGVLNVTYGGPNTNFADGMVFNLFDAASFSGSFAAVNLPDLTGTGLDWQDNLATTGTIAVVPETSAMLLGALGSLALLRRRR